MKKVVTILIVLIIYFNDKHLLAFTKNAPNKEFFHMHLDSPNYGTLEYQLILDDDYDSPVTDLKGPIDDTMQLTPEEEAELKNGICKIILLEPDPLAKLVFKRNEIALRKMERNMYMYILGESLADLSREFLDVKERLKKDGVTYPLTHDEQEAVISADSTHCDIQDLKEIFELLVSLPDKYEDLSRNDTAWDALVAMQIDRVYDYVNTHFMMFKQEMLRLKNTKNYYERKNFFRKRDGKSFIMYIFYEWFENTVCRPRKVHEREIRNAINKHLKWLVNLPIQ